MPTDAELLQRYVQERSETAFAELVRRHLNLVYAAALRRTNGRHALAEEIAQIVFTDLARKAAQLIRHPTLTGWLYRSTRYAAIDAARAERRRKNLAESFSAMAEDLSSEEARAGWDQLRPMIDAAMDELKESDREIMLLRFFQGLTFTEVGTRLNINENAARMRTERALEKLRGFLAKRGVVSTAALVGLLQSETLVAAPTYLASAVTMRAMSVAPAGALATFFTQLLTSKIAAVTVSAALGTVIATMASAKLLPGITDAELSALRTENARLTQAAAMADHSAARNATVVQAIEKRFAEIHTPGSHRNHGQATPRDAVLSLWWAADSGDFAAVARFVTYDDKALNVLRALHDGMPETIRAQYRTPEELGAFFWVAGTLLRPLPGADVCEKQATACIITELSPGRMLLRQPRQTSGGIEAVQVGEAWRIVLHGDEVRQMVESVLNNEMLAKLGVALR